MSASEALCWTDVTFSPNGRKMTKADDLQFDRLWMAQLLLQINGKLYKGNIRGEADRELYAAAAKFQEKLGRTGTGILDNELIFRMIDGARSARCSASRARPASTRLSDTTRSRYRARVMTISG